MEIKLEQESVLDITPSISSDFLKGEKGSQGIQGPKGERGDTGPQGPKGENGEKGPASAAIQETEPNDENIILWLNPNDDSPLAEDGATFIPSIDTNGNISWSNDKNLDNPVTVNIKGPQGIQGPKGETGEKGPQGPKGEKGDKGEDGTVAFESLTSEQKASLKGENGIGIPEGGTSGQILSKKTDADYDTEWINPSEGTGAVDGTMIFKGTWNDTDTYSKNDVVEYGNLFFVALSDISANKNPNSNASLWKKMNYTSNYSNVQTTNSTSTYYLSGTPGTGNNQSFVMPSTSTNRAKFIPSTGAYDFPILKQNSQDVATKNYVDKLIGNLESLLSEV